MITIKWLGWANFLVQIRDKTICFDPFFPSEEKADLILVSHSHPDHCNAKAINSLRKENTVILTNKEAARNVPGAQVIKIGEVREIDGAKIKATYAYNLNIPNHQKGKDMGFIVKVEGNRIYHAGDTDFIDEMKEIKNIDLALLPVGGTYTMDVAQAIEAIKVIQPRIVVPMHHGKIEVEFQGKSQQIEFNPDLEKFKKEVQDSTDSEVIILSQGEEYSLE